MTKERPKTLCIAISPTVLAAVDKLAERRFTTRSEFIRQALLAEIEKQGGFCPLVAA
jgi:metal-responsive CopG/Arc/MetJ family transcriptional regulator